MTDAKSSTVAKSVDIVFVFIFCNKIFRQPEFVLRCSFKLKSTIVSLGILTFNYFFCLNQAGGGLVTQDRRILTGGCTYPVICLTKGNNMTLNLNQANTSLS